VLVEQRSTAGGLLVAHMAAQLAVRDSLARTLQRAWQRRGVRSFARALRIRVHTLRDVAARQMQCAGFAHALDTWRAAAIVAIQATVRGWAQRTRRERAAAPRAARGGAPSVASLLELVQPSWPPAWWGAAPNLPADRAELDRLLRHCRAVYCRLARARERRRDAPRLRAEAIARQTAREAADVARYLPSQSVCARMRARGTIVDDLAAAERFSSPISPARVANALARRDGWGWDGVVHPLQAAMNREAARPRGYAGAAAEQLERGALADSHGGDDDDDDRDGDGDENDHDDDDDDDDDDDGDAGAQRAAWQAGFTPPSREGERAAEANVDGAHGPRGLDAIAQRERRAAATLQRVARARSARARRDDGDGRARVRLDAAAAAAAARPAQPATRRERALASAAAHAADFYKGQQPDAAFASSAAVGAAAVEPRGARRGRLSGELRAERLPPLERAGERALSSAERARSLVGLLDQAPKSIFSPLVPAVFVESPRKREQGRAGMSEAEAALHRARLEALADQKPGAVGTLPPPPSSPSWTVTDAPLKFAPRQLRALERELARALEAACVALPKLRRLLLEGAVGLVVYLAPPLDVLAFVSARCDVVGRVAVAVGAHVGARTLRAVWRGSRYKLSSRHPVEPASPMRTTLAAVATGHEQPLGDLPVAVWLEAREALGGARTRGECCWWPLQAGAFRERAPPTGVLVSRGLGSPDARAASPDATAAQQPQQQPQQRHAFDEANATEREERRANLTRCLRHARLALDTIALAKLAPQRPLPPLATSAASPPAASPAVRTPTSARSDDDEPMAPLFEVTVPRVQPLVLTSLHALARFASVGKRFAASAQAREPPRPLPALPKPSVDFQYPAEGMGELGLLVGSEVEADASKACGAQLSQLGDDGHASPALPPIARAAGGVRRAMAGSRTLFRGAGDEALRDGGLQPSAMQSSQEILRLDGLLDASLQVPLPLDDSGDARWSSPSRRAAMREAEQVGGARESALLSLQSRLARSPRAC
jgi:hypothetical protein